MNKQIVIALIVVVLLSAYPVFAGNISPGVTDIVGGVSPTPTTTISPSSSSRTTSSTSTSSGGFGVISNEPFPNIDIAESIVKDLHINITTIYKFSKTSIYEVIVSPTRNEDEVMIRVENLKGISSKVDAPPVGEVFKYTNIYFGSNYLKSATVRFKLDSSLISNKNINLVYWNGKTWETLDTTLIGTDDKYYYYETVISGLSRFSIVGVNIETSTPTPTPTPEVIIDVVQVVTPLPTEPQQSPITVKSPGFDMAIAFISIMVIAIRRRL